MQVKASNSHVLRFVFITADYGLKPVEPRVPLVLPYLILDRQEAKGEALKKNPTSNLPPDEEARLRILGETAKIGWKELQRYFAQGIVIMAKPGLDLVDVACAMTRDNEDQVRHWMDTGELLKVSDSQAMEWLEANALMWAVVVKPWVLVQPVISRHSLKDA